MKYIFTIGLVFSSLVCTMGQSVGQRWIVKVRKEIKPSFRKAGRSIGYVKPVVVKPLVDHPAKGLYRITTDTGYTREKLLEQLGGDNTVLYLEQDHIGYATAREQETPNDTFFDRQWYLFNDGTFSLFGLDAREGADINIQEAWDITRGTEDVVVAILDTGINPDHPEFSGRLWSNTGEIAGNGLDDDGNGFADDMYGWDFVNEDADPRDDGGHGNAIAGVIGAVSNNSTGVAGIDQHSQLMICKVLDRNQTGFYSDWAAGIYYAVDNGADVINMSVAGDQDLRVLADAIEYAARNGVIIVSSTGNNNTSDVFYPSGYPSVVAVGSTDPDDRRSIMFNGNPNFGSNYGQHLDVVAPGNAVFSLGISANDQSAIWSGTSVSCAMVSGMISLMRSVRPEASINELLGVLYNTSDDQVGAPEEDSRGWDMYHGFGRVNAGAAVTSLRNDTLTDPFQLQLYPNPSDRDLNIVVMVSSPVTTSLEIIDHHGRLTFSRSFELNSPELEAYLDVSSFPEGMYVMHIRQNGLRLTKRFVVVH